MIKRIAVAVLVASVIHIVLLLQFEGYAEMWDAIYRWVLNVKANSGE